ncbi:MAG: DUF2252 family protein [Pseudobdellovibrionaceae bacterium]
MKKHLIPTYTNLLLKFLTAVLFFVPVTVPAQMACEKVLEITSTEDSNSSYGSWRPSKSTDLFANHRANAPHYWASMKAEEENETSKSRFFLIRGVVGGDLHILNVGDTPLKKGGRKSSLIDVDDSGVNVSLPADFLRFLVSNQVSEFEVSAKDMFEAYRNGVNGKKMDKPKYLEKILDKSNSDFAERQKEYIDKITDHNHFNSNAHVSHMEQAPPEVKNLFDKAKETFEKFLRDYEILDVAFRVKQDGGSQKLPRFWYLIKNKGEKHIWEFKEAGVPAVSNFAEQPDHVERLEAVDQVYRPDEEILGPFEYVHIENTAFLLRERFHNYMDLDPNKIKDEDEIEDAKQVYLYFANRIGRWHGQQKAGSDLSSYLDEEGTFEEFMIRANKYIAKMKEEIKKAIGG